MQVSNPVRSHPPSPLSDSPPGAAGLDDQEPVAHPPGPFDLLTYRKINQSIHRHDSRISHTNAQEVVNQLLGPVQYPLLRRSLRRLRSTHELDAFLRPVLVPGDHARGGWFAPMTSLRILSGACTKHPLVRSNPHTKRNTQGSSAGTTTRASRRGSAGSFCCGPPRSSRRSGGRRGLSSVRLERVRIHCRSCCSRATDTLGQPHDTEPPWLPASGSGSSLPSFQEVVDWFGLADWNRKVRKAIDVQRGALGAARLNARGHQPLPLYTQTSPARRAWRASGGQTSSANWRRRLVDGRFLLIERPTSNGSINLATTTTTLTTL